MSKYGKQVDLLVNTKALETEELREAPPQPLRLKDMRAWDNSAEYELFLYSGKAHRGGRYED